MSIASSSTLPDGAGPTGSSSASQRRSPTEAERVLVIGGGAAGLVTLRNLLDAQRGGRAGSQPCFDVTLVERRDDVGGVWYWNDDTYELERGLTPDRTQGVWPLRDGRGRPHWPSPAYLNLKGNVLPEYLQFSGHPFPPPAHGDTFPTLRETHEYLRSFAEPLAAHIRLGIEVLRAEELVGGGWQVEWKDWNAIGPSQPGSSASSSGGGGAISVHRFDRVVVACGWYDTPMYPNAAGLDEARAAGYVHHAKHYRDSEQYRGKRVVVVGNNNSSNEVAAHLAVHNSPERPVYKSAKRPPINKCPCLADRRIQDVGVIERYEVADDAADGSKRVLHVHIEGGQVIRDVDYVLLGTGYGCTLPFLRVLTDEARRSGTQLTEPLTPPELQGIRVPHLFRHLLYAKSPTLTLGFTGVLVSYFPFNSADLTSRWLALVWSGRLAHVVPDSIEDRLQDERARLEYVLSQKQDNINKRRAAAGLGPVEVDRGDPLNALGFHNIGGSLIEPGPSELEFAAQLRREIVSVDPAMADLYDDWGEERERKQFGMYEVKRQWLVDNERRIKTDPFDLLGRNSAYRHLAAGMVAPSDDVEADGTSTVAPIAGNAPSTPNGNVVGADGQVAQVAPHRGVTA